MPGTAPYALSSTVSSHSLSRLVILSLSLFLSSLPHAHTRLECPIQRHMPTIVTSHSLSRFGLVILGVYSLSVSNASSYSLSVHTEFSFFLPLSLSLSHTPRILGAEPYARSGELSFSIEYRYFLSFYNASYFLSSLLFSLSPPLFLSLSLFL